MLDSIQFILEYIGAVCIIFIGVYHCAKHGDRAKRFFSCLAAVATLLAMLYFIPLL